MWAIRVPLELAENDRDLAIFNLAVDCNLRAVQRLLGHSKMDSTDWYLGVELKDAFAIAEAIEI